ncbi:MAG: aldo/keto reductase [Deltaproteobacteria bacterium]|nr:aldo/keto reductase [Deltaproteobacteria bacterium]
MKTRALGSSSLQLSEIGLGAWAIGGGGWKFGWGAQDDDQAVRAIRRALDLGINWIDTAPVYGLGHSEELVARGVEGRRDEVILATKCSLVWDAAGNISSSLERQSVVRECEESLRRLRTDRIDLYQVHWPNDDPRIEEGWEAIGRLIDEGKVRYAGVSNFAEQQIERALAVRPVASLQAPYGMLQRDAESALLPYCYRSGIGVLAYSPLGSGLLSGHFERSRLSPEDWRASAPDFNEPNLSINLQVADGLGPIARRRRKTVSQVAIAWVLRRAEVASAIVGARREAQVDEAIGATGWSLAAEDIEEIERLLAQRERTLPPAPVRFR